MLHSATLIHDDVVDNADTRRGLASINAIWKNKVAVLIGDYLLARGLLLSVDNNDFEFLRITSDAVRRMSEGELLQIQKTRRLDIDEQTYFRIIGDKTASLISTCCELGAASVSKNGEYKQLMKEYGENIGIAFQIRDDLFDYLGRKSVIGKPIGTDMKEKKLTLPLIYSFQQSPRSEARSIMRIIKNGAKRKDLEAVVEYVQTYGGIDYARQKAEAYANEARKNLEQFPDSPSKESLSEFVDFVMERNK
jgi:octaprenyl-diphosphate synthase